MIGLSTGCGRRIPLGVVMLSLTVLSGVRAQVGTSKHLYTEPDPNAAGGIRSAITGVPKPLDAVFAIPPDEPLLVYKGTVTGLEKQAFEFRGLPVSRYDLVLVFDDTVYEGLRLTRGDDALTRNDMASITNIVMRSEPYFNEKTIHRLAGTTGHMEGHARAFCTFLRSLTSTGFSDGKPYHDHRRSLKLALLEQVGPGWQVADTREIYVKMVKPGTGHVAHVYARNLGRIRVVDSVKDLGVIDLAGAWK